ncbi:plectin 1 isoform 8 [alpha proteobacterium U9-1i]|nr:plectin 1 isoform 8 [alpha proteobacterium U9-1i]
MKDDAAMDRASPETETSTNAPREPGAMIARLSMGVAIVWIVGVGAISFALLGVAGVAALEPAQIGALVAAAILPALMAVFSGAAAREGARARAEAQRLADAADRLMNPEQSAEEAAKKLAKTVRGEISQLDQALEHTLAKLAEVEGMVTRQVRAVDDMSDQAKAGATQMISGMERERDELLNISRDLTGQAQMIGDSISRHTQAISHAARQAEAEVRAADQALDHRMTSFGAAAALINDRTHALSGAAQASADSALRLEHALSNALEVLAKATDLTDAARQSADAATLAANSTASAVRDSTSRAIDDAKRAADVIRGEAVNVEREAAIALERLRDAAEEARSAAVGARVAAEDEVRTRPRSPQQAPQQARRAAEPEAPRYEHPDWRNTRDPLEAAPPPRSRRDAEPPMFGEREERAPERERERQGDRGAPPPGWTWRELLSNFDEDQPAGTQAASEQRRRRTQPNEDPVARLTQQISEPRHAAAATTALPVVDLIAHAGLRLDEVFSASGLDRIAQRSRSGSQARRRAVRDAAPGAVQHLTDYFAQDGHANQEAMQFLRNDGARIAELLARGRASMNADATRAFLLIDSAAG